MNILVIHSRDLEKGSTRFRVVQYQPWLQSQGVQVDYVNRKLLGKMLNHISDYDVVINQKCLLRMGLQKQLRARAKRLLFDYDDAIYTRPGKPYGLITGFRVRRRMAYWMRQADVVTTSSEYLANHARKYQDNSRARVLVLPMGVDLSTWSPDTSRQSEKIVLGWAGAPVNLKHIERLEPVLKVILDRHSNVEVAVFSGDKPKLSIPHRYVPYRDGGEPEFIRSIDIGLLPLVDDEHARGKSPIKAIQYLACGVPVAGNVYGATAEIINADNGIAVESESQWLDALDRLIKDAGLRKRLGQSGRQHIEQHNDRTVLQQQLLNAISGRDNGE